VTNTVVVDGGGSGVSVTNNATTINQ